MSVDSALPQPPTQDVEPHGPIEDNRDVLLDERVRQEGHHPGEAQQEGEQDGVPHGVDDPAPRAHVPDNNNKKISKSGQFLSVHLRFPALYAVQTALMVTARLRTKTRPGGEMILDKVMK